MQKATRSTRDRMLAGVAGGLAEQFGVSARVIRLALVATSFINGLGILLYIGFWLVLPTDTVPSDIQSRRWWRDSPTLIAAIALLLGAVGTLAAFNLVDFSSGASGLAIAGIGALALWLRADFAKRSTNWKSDLWLGILGTFVLTVGLFLAVGSSTGWLEILRAVIVLTLIIGGVGIGLAPTVIRWRREREAVRFEEIRREEREAVAAHLHDSVLQTFALIRRRSSEAEEVNRLARVGESSLRDWLYPRTNEYSEGFSAVLRQYARAIEAEYPCTIEVVTVGDTELNDAYLEMLAATKEAMVNAAKHSQSRDPIHVFADCSAEGVEVFVRDRGVGFETLSVPADRHGLRQSVIARMQRLGGTAQIVSSREHGTEVHLLLRKSQ